MAGCYECNHCGKCTMPDLPIAAMVLVCIDCGREIQPGENPKKCACCGSERIEYKRGGSGA
ncbi:hypothetical protein [Raoultibacter massiliensis]|uniref:Zinc ribbon domain-containing protein n=1 Tax=Raoultibacter massiliensis TaxID=1852371 RepID=A0ABV1JB77_9ACTN|nr:hypothetical protein [Raoultibacter massiliensis]